MHSYAKGDYCSEGETPRREDRNSFADDSEPDEDDYDEDKKVRAVRGGAVVFACCKV